MTILVRPGPKAESAALSDADFARIAKIAKAGWGLKLDSAKGPLIQSRLGRRMRDLGLQDLSDYCQIVESGDPVECDHFVTALTTNVTHFYRESHHFDFLEAKVLPDLLAAARRGEKLRIWSAGCSSGQEPYSLAASILSLAPDAARFDIKILATDIDPVVLAKAEAGRYGAQERSFPTTGHATRVFGPAADGTGDLSVRAELRSLITFRRLNLIRPWPISGRFDLIMCRNVAIYFDRPTQADIWSRFAQSLVPGGHLFIGHSERITTPSEFELESAGITTYRRGPSSTAVGN